MFKIKIKQQKEKTNWILAVGVITLIIVVFITSIYLIRPVNNDNDDNDDIHIPDVSQNETEVINPTFRLEFNIKSDVVSYPEEINNPIDVRVFGVDLLVSNGTTFRYYLNQSWYSKTPEEIINDLTNFGLNNDGSFNTENFVDDFNGKNYYFSFYNISVYVVAIRLYFLAYCDYCSETTIVNLKGFYNLTALFNFGIQFQYMAITECAPRVIQFDWSIYMNKTSPPNYNSPFHNAVSYPYDYFEL